jgi:hypothetical protein
MNETRYETKQNFFSETHLLLFFSSLLRYHRGKRELRERERETIFGSEGGVIIAQTHRTRREVKNFLGLGHNIIAEVLVSFSFSFSLSLSLYPERTFPRTQRYKKKRSLPLSFSSGSDGFFKSYFDLSWRNAYVMYCHHRHLRGLAGSRACFPRPKNAHSARAISFFCISFTGNVWLNCLLLS